LIFEIRDLGPVFRAEIWRIVEEVSLLKGGDEKQAGAHEENRPASWLIPVATFIKELAA
jgi:hypothetical protein